MVQAYVLNGSIATMRAWIRNMAMFFAWAPKHTNPEFTHTQSTVIYTKICSAGIGHLITIHDPVWMDTGNKETTWTNQNNQSIKQSIHQSVHQSISPSIHQSINPSVHQSINPSIHQSIHQSIIQTIFSWNWSFSVSSWPMVVLNVKSPRHHWFFGAQPGHRTQQRPVHMGGNLKELKNASCEMNIFVQKLLAHWCVVQIFLKHSITNTFPFSRRFQYYGYKTIAQIAPESFPFFSPPAVLALESQTFCFGEIQWFASRVSTKHIEGGARGKILSMFANGHTKNDALLTSGSPASIHDVRIEWFEIHCCNLLAIGIVVKINW